MRISMGLEALDPVIAVHVRLQCDKDAKKREEAEAKQSAAKETEAA